MKSDADTRDLLKLRRAFARESTPVWSGGFVIGSGEKGSGFTDESRTMVCRRRHDAQRSEQRQSGGEAGTRIVTRRVETRSSRGSAAALGRR